MTWDDIKVPEDDFLSADWNNMVTDQKARLKKISEDEKTGSDCTGSDGAPARVLTLSNTELTDFLQVWVEGRMIIPSNYTATHAISGTTVEFNNAIYDSDEIYVIAYKAS